MSTDRNGAGAPARPTRFTQLHLANWKNFQSVDAALSRRVFLVGANASGKSNLLDALRFLRDVARPGGGLRYAVEQRGSISRLRCLAARRYSDVAIRVRMSGAESEPEWSYELRFNNDNLGRPIVKKEFVSFGDHTLLERPDSEDESDSARLSQTHLEQVNVNVGFRGIADFLATVRYLHLVPQLVREPDRSVGRQNDPFGGDFLEQVARTTPRTRDARLRRIQEALKIAVPKLDELELSRDEVTGTPHLRGRYQHWRPGAGWQTEAQLSDGTLRLLGLLWSILDGSGPLLLEEPELSLHPEVVRHIPQLLARAQRQARRQVLLSTHSTELLLDSGIGLDEVLLLKPEENGTEVAPASAFSAIRELVAGGVSLGEAVVPETRPEAAHQLPLLAEPRRRRAG